MQASRTRTILAIAVFSLLLLTACPKKQVATSNIGTVGSNAGTPSAAQSPFYFEAYPLAEKSLFSDFRILTTEPNTFAAEDLLYEDGQASKIEFRPGGIETIMNVPFKDKARKRTELFFPDRRILVSVARRGDEQARALVVDTETGMELDVTPANLPALWKEGSRFPLIGWTGKHGLCLHARGNRDDELVIWQGHNSLTEVQRLPATLAIGQRLSADGLQFLIVSSSMELLAYDEVSGMFEVDEDGLDLAAAIANAAGFEQGSPVRFAAAQGIAVMQTRDGSHWAVVGEADREDYIEVHDASGVTPEGRRRIPGPGDLLGGSEAQRLRREGVQQPPDVINEGFVLPVNDRHVGVFDLVYQRLVVIGLRDED